MIDCMTCLVQLAQGCPTNSKTIKKHGVTHASVTISGTTFGGSTRVPAHGFRYSAKTGRWMFFIGIEPFWAAQDQT